MNYRLWSGYCSYPSTLARTTWSRLFFFSSGIFVFHVNSWQARFDFCKSLSYLGEVLSCYCRGCADVESQLEDAIAPPTTKWSSYFIRRAELSPGEGRARHPSQNRAAEEGDETQVMTVSRRIPRVSFNWFSLSGHE